MFNVVPFMLGFREEAITTQFSVVSVGTCNK